ncbi:hypothetical protein IFM89_006693 [Coptis chinensis]|uniref:Uncharacterized protein n=1 Tax=Coptis chinensis TaxID=261450 RepID=A0A835MHI9_9MAGN|nr:hypothetical protein IFM89_006693 [Coptis chinensis]
MKKTCFNSFQGLASNLYGNKLSGGIPPGFERLESMTSLNLSSNNLKGPIPIELSRIGNLDTLDLSNNKIYGSIPSFIGDLEHLLKLLSSIIRCLSISIFLLYRVIANALYVYPLEFLARTVDLVTFRPSLEIEKCYGDRHVEKINSMVKFLGNFGHSEICFHSDAINCKEHQRISFTLIGYLLSIVNCFSLNVLNVSYNNLAGDIPLGKKFSMFPPSRFYGWIVFSAALLEILGFAVLGLILLATILTLLNEFLVISLFSSNVVFATSIYKATILGIALGALVILLMILVAVCRPHNPPPFSEGALDKPVFLFFHQISLLPLTCVWSWMKNLKTQFIGQDYLQVQSNNIDSIMAFGFGDLTMDTTAVSYNQNQLWNENHLDMMGLDAPDLAGLEENLQVFSHYNFNEHSFSALTNMGMNISPYYEMVDHQFEASPVGGPIEKSLHGFLNFPTSRELHKALGPSLQQSCNDYLWIPNGSVMMS